MSIKFDRLRLSGFKSFVDATELLIESGLTGIVGPNGCGKSNVLESLRWVMGASSAKALRGSGMEDVIFAGTSGRPARNVAEVSLLLDNTARTAPAAFNDSEQIEVVRRIERDAGSAYRINGKDVRARDVQLLFADSSTGSNSPALVRQGQISELINAKPENRRKLLEEAAGIAGLHSRRHEAELRLNAAENNLVRLEDVEQQLEEQLSALKRQARQATRYRNLSGHIRRAESLSLHLRWSEARAAVTHTQNEKSDIETQVAEKTRDAANASTAQAEAVAALPPLRDAEVRTAAAVSRLNVERENFDAEETRARQQAEALEGRLAQIDHDQAREESLKTDAAQVISRLEEEDAALDSQQAAQQDSLAEAERRVTQADETLALRESARQTLTEELAHLTARRTALEHTTAETAGRIRQITDQLENTREQYSALLKQASGDSRNDQAAARIDAARRQAEHAEMQATEADQARARALALEKEARAPLEDAEHRVNSLKAEAKALSDLLNVNEGELWPPVIDALIVTPGYETALGAALGDDLNVPADEAAPIHWSVLDGPPPGAQALPGGARPMSDFVEAPGPLVRRLAQIGLVEKADGPRLQRFLCAGQRLVSREGDLWRWDGFTAAAEAQTAAATRLAQRNRLTELDDEISQAAERQRMCQKIFTNAIEEAMTTARHEEAARTAWRNAQDELAAAREAKAELDQANADYKSRLAALEESEKRLNENLDDLTSRRQRASADLDSLGDGHDLENRIAVLRDEIDSLRTRLLQARSAFEAEKREAALAQKRRQAISVELGAWRSRHSAATGQIEELTARRATTQADLNDLRLIPAAMEEKRKALLGAISTAEEARTIAADSLAEAETRQRSCDSHLREAEKTLSALREHKARLEAIMESAREKLSEIEARSFETLDCAACDLLEKAELKEGEALPSLEQIDIKCERLKRERENMGAVNLRAAEEAEELGARVAEMEQERNDLESAIAKLRRGIANLNREGRTRLLEAFERVNAQFSRLFGVLFEGGSAKLELTEADDPLSAGLEIFARPPGKRLQSMSLLSGGEQALTAVALIFAVFLSNPTPICVLDEVEAPLDDSNVERFCSLLDEMIKSTDTRFIIITHNALTMSRMDRLYGVTMSERGISQLVSVDLTGAAQIRATG